MVEVSGCIARAGCSNQPIFSLALCPCHLVPTVSPYTQLIIKYNVESVSWQASHDLSCFLSLLYRSWFQRGRVLGGQAPAPHCRQEEGVQPPEQAHGQVVEPGELRDLTLDGCGNVKASSFACAEVEVSVWLATSERTSWPVSKFVCKIHHDNCLTSHDHDLLAVCAVPWIWTLVTRRPVGSHGGRLGTRLLPCT